MSKIEWTGRTWNVLGGCSMVSPGCLNCYAMRMAHRQAAMGQPKYQGTTKLVERGVVWSGKINLDESALMAPFTWKKPQTIFVNSMSDTFHKDVPDEFIARLFAVMVDTRRHTYQVLTKRPDRMAKLAGDGSFWHLTRRWLKGNHRQAWDDVDSIRMDVVGLPPNIQVGTSCEDQDRANKRIPHLLKCKAAVRFLSLEPLLGPIDLRLCPGKGGFETTNKMDDPVMGLDASGACNHSPVGMGLCPTRKHWIVAPWLGAPNCGVDWVIVGGESGPGARPCDVDWIRSIVQQCKSAGVPCFVKQLGSNIIHLEHPVHLRDSKGGDPAEWPEELRVRQMPRVESGAV